MQKQKKTTNRDPSIQRRQATHSCLASLLATYSTLNKINVNRNGLWLDQSTDLISTALIA